MARGSAEVEEVTLRLNQQVSGPAAVASGAASQLAAQIDATTAAMRSMQAAGRVDALGKLEQQIVASSGALREMAAQMRLLNSGKVVNVDEYRSLKAAIDATKGSLAKAQGEYAALSGIAKKASAAQTAGAKESKAGLDATARAARLLGGESGATAAKVIEFGSSLKALGPYGIAAGVSLAIVAAGVLGLVAVFVAGVRALGQFRDELLKLQGAMLGNAQAGKEAQAAINAVSSSAFNALPRDKLADYATQLGQLRLRGKDLQTALEGAAIAGSAMGDSAAQAFIGAASTAKHLEGGVDALTARYKKIWGGVAASQAYSLDVQFRRMREDITALFSGATLDPFISGMHNITSMFSQTSELGIGLRDAVSGVQQKLLSVATAALPYVKGALLGAAIAGVNMYIVFKKVYNAIRDTIGPAVQFTGIFKDASAAIVAGKVAAYSFLGVMLLVATSIALALAPLTILLSAIGLAIYGVVVAARILVGFLGFMYTTVVGGFTAIKDALMHVSLADVAKNMIRSFTDAISGGLPSVSSVMGFLGDAAKSGLRAALGIHSPSRFAQDTADNVTHTYISRVEDAAPDARESFDDFVSPKQVKSEAKAARSSGRATVVYVEIGTERPDDRALLDKMRILMRQLFDVEVRAVEPG